jgi:hypothetical protein
MRVAEVGQLKVISGVSGQAGVRVEGAVGNIGEEQVLVLVQKVAFEGRESALRAFFGALREGHNRVEIETS